VENHSDKNLSADGARHNVTIETMNFLKNLLTFRAPLEMVLRIGWTEGKDHPAPTILGSAILFLMSALETNLESKSKLFKPATLRKIFVLNNYFYIQKQMKVEDMVRLTGSKMTADYERKIVKLKSEYRNESWEEVGKYLDSIDAADIIAKNDRKAIKNKFSGFNEAFELQYNAQRLFSVTDSDLRSQLRTANVQHIVPLYEAFLQTYVNAVAI
jgi:exocyst complex protein 7